VEQAGIAKGLWDTFTATYKAKNNARKISLRKELNTLNKEPSELITKYVARAKTIWSDLVATGTEMLEVEVTLLILTGLPKEYEVVATVLEIRSEELTIDEVVPHPLPVEQRLTRDQDTVPVYAIREGRRQQARQQHRSTAPAQHSKYRRPSAGRCFYCDKPGHIKADCRERIRDEKERGTSQLFMSAAGMQHPMLSTRELL